MPPHNAPLHNNLMAIYNYTKIPSPGDEGNVLAQPSRTLAFKVSNITLEMLNTLYIISHDSTLAGSWGVCLRFNCP